MMFLFILIIYNLVINKTTLPQYEYILEVKLSLCIAGNDIIYKNIFRILNFKEHIYAYTYFNYTLKSIRLNIKHFY